MVTTAAVLVGCKKEKESVGSITEPEQMSAINNMDEYLISFKKKLLLAQKGNEAISIEQAQRDLGNLLNFDFGDANYPMDVWQFDTLHLSLANSGTSVDMACLAETYNKALTNILHTYEQVKLPEKSILSISCQINQETKDSDVADVQLIITSRGLSTPYLKTGFDSTDNWHVGELLGKCDGTCVGDDHITMLEKVYNNNRPILACLNGRVYYTDVYDGDYFNSSEFPETNPNVYYNWGYRLWSGYGYEVLNNCVEYPEMIYYYDNFCQILADRILPGHVLVSIDRCFLDTPVSLDPERFYYFACEFTSGKPNCTEEALAY